MAGKAGLFPRLGAWQEHVGKVAEALLDLYHPRKSPEHKLRYAKAIKKMSVYVPPAVMMLSNPPQEISSFVREFRQTPKKCAFGMRLKPRGSRGIG